MQTQIVGTANPGAIAPAAQAVDPTFLAARVALRPLEYAGFGRTLGHYRVAASTSAIAPAANSVMMSARWTDQTSLFVLTRLLVGVTVVTAVTAQRQDPIVATIHRAYIVSETTNITSIVPTANNQKMRTSMGTSGAAQLVVASAAAGITGGTSTADAQAFGQTSLSPALIGLGTGVPMQELYVSDSLYGHPPVLTIAEGLKVLWGPTALATGTVTVNLVMSWAEVVLF